MKTSVQRTAINLLERCYEVKFMNNISRGMAYRSHGEANTFSNFTEEALQMEALGATRYKCDGSRGSQSEELCLKRQTALIELRFNCCNLSAVYFCL
jgi:hypothetical protein